MNIKLDVRTKHSVDQVVDIAVRWQTGVEPGYINVRTEAEFAPLIY